MPLEQTITIVNNSGKIISTGKQLLSVFKEAKGAYQDKKAQIKSDKTGLSRAQTFDHHPDRQRHYDTHDYEDYYEDYDDDDYYSRYQDQYGRRHSYNHAPSEASSRRTARRSRSVHAKSSAHRDHRDRDHGTSNRSHAPLTTSNLKTHSEVSSTAPTRTPHNYRSPYAETARNMTASKMDAAHTEIRSLAVSERRPPTTAMTRRRSMSELSKSRKGTHKSTRHSNEHRGSERGRSSGKPIDMNLAYGSIPPDLEDRIDLDPAYQEAAKEKRAKALVKKVEGLLDEANCVKHSATSTISHLQQNPDAAAAVALTLAELSSLVTKMSPAILGFIKGGSPAVWALLASPQFLIGSAAVVGVTVVMFGGWKIVKKVKEEKAAREALAYQGVPMDRPAPMRTQSQVTGSMDEALIVDDELSSIESWRRGILPEFGENESADMELITPEAERAHRDRHIRASRTDDFDTRSHRSTRTSKTAKTSKTSKTAKTAKTKKTSERDIPERKSSKQATAESVAPTERSKKTSAKKGKAPLKAIEDGRSRRDEDELDIVFRPKAQRQDNMLKALFKNKKEKEEKGKELVHA